MMRWPNVTAPMSKPRCGRRTWPCIGQRRRDAVNTASSTAPWTNDCSSASSSRPEMKGAIEAGQIVPYYQPLVDLETSETVGHEVLARWKHPTRGLLLPETFIPIAEDTATIGEMTYALLTQA
ncbi:MAG TPA: hypothetical protein DIC31_05700 [Rhizobiales bacterium]|nr:hypothetical protein [Hyphomicrobiales bacterium]HCL61961.1 hypothetical protein [Hyphomicrobiales bacterium]